MPSASQLQLARESLAEARLDADAQFYNECLTAPEVTTVLETALSQHRFMTLDAIRARLAEVNRLILSEACDAIDADDVLAKAERDAEDERIDAMITGAHEDAAHDLGDWQHEQSRDRDLDRRAGAAA